MTGTPLNPAHIQQVAFGFMGSRTFFAAVELGLFTELTKGAPTADELTKRLGLHPRSARDFLDALVALELLARDETGRYVNTPETNAFLDRNKPDYIGGLLEMAGRRLYGFWNNLTTALKTGEPQNETAGDPTTFEKLYADPQRLELFLGAMTGVSRMVARVLAEKFPWDRYKNMIDIGTAQGCVPVTLAQQHPHLQCGGFDLPPVKPIFERFAAANGVGGRVRFYAGDFMKDELPSADVLVMGHILHDWDLPTKRHLIAAAHKALSKGGVLIAYDMMIDDERRANAMGLLMSLNMLIETAGGFDYTGADCRKWFSESGFTDVHTVPLAGPHSMTVGTK